MGTFFRHLQFTRLGDLHSLGGFVSRTLRYVFHLFDDIIALEDFTKDYMLSIKPTKNLNQCWNWIFFCGRKLTL